MELRRIMTTEAWKMALDICKSDYVQRIMNSEPTDRAARDMAYLEARAFDNMIATLNTFVAIADHETLRSQVEDEQD